MVCFDNPLKLEECSLYAAGHCSTVSPFRIIDGAYSILSVTDGQGILATNDGEYSIKENDIFLAFPHESFSVSGDVQYDAVAVNISSGRYSEAFGLVRISNIGGKNRLFRDENVSKTLGNLCKEIASGANYFSNELVSLLCSQLLLYSLRAFGSSVAIRSQKTDDVNFKVCGQVMSYIDGNVYKMKNLKEVASAMGYNYSYISTLFHKTTGITLNNYFKTRRMNEAKRLLTDSTLSISEIAREMNYSSVYAFSKAFKEYFGTSPGHYSGRFPSKEL